MLDPRSFPAGALVVFVGPAGAGKSRAAEGFPASARVCLDQLRAAVADDPGSQEATSDAVALQDLIVEARLRRGLLIVLDATNVERRVRVSLVERAHRHGRRPVAVVFATPVDLCVRRNARRPANRRVPEEVLRRQHEQAAQALPLLVKEGFTDVRIVGPSGVDAASGEVADGCLSGLGASRAGWGAGQPGPPQEIGE
jgi:predicted kinase